nr:MAG: glycerophosphoryl diester phosphodiesterase family protein [Bacteriophage sp.]
MASSLYNLALDFSKELNYTKAIMARQGDKGITVTVKPFLNGLQMDTSGGTFTLKGTTPSNRYVDSVATSVTSEEVTFSLDGTFMSEAGYYKHCYVEYRKDDQILTTQDIIFFSLGVSDISQGQADEYVSQLEELIRKYNETFDAFMAEIKGRVDSLNKQITDLTGQAKTLQDKLDALKEEISKLGNLQVMYSNSIDFGDYDYSTAPNLMRTIKFSDLSTMNTPTGTVPTGVTDKGDYFEIDLTTMGVTEAKVLWIPMTPRPQSGKQYTYSIELMCDEGEMNEVYIRPYFRNADGTSGVVFDSITKTVTSTWKRYSRLAGKATNDMENSTVQAFQLYFPAAVTRRKLYVRYNIMVQEGDQTSSQSATKGACKIDWLKIEKGDTRTPNIEQYKYRGIGMRDSNNPKDYVWDLAPEYVEDNLATDVKISEITGKANNYTDGKVAIVNKNLSDISADLNKQIANNKNNIATNTTNISTNTTAISTLQNKNLFTQNKSTHGLTWIAHRGNNSTAPENSIVAFENVYRHQAIETDIQLTSDNRWVVMHDETVDRTTNGTGKISDMTYDQFRALRIDTGANIDKLTDDEKIPPNLEEFLLICKKNNRIPVVEIKATGGYTKEQLQLIKTISDGIGMTEKTIFISFNYDMLVLMREIFPFNELQWVYQGTINTDVITKLKTLGLPCGLDINENNASLTKDNVNLLHANRLKIGAWTVRYNSFEKMKDLGIDYITTNSPSGYLKYAELSLRNGFTPTNDNGQVPQFAAELEGGYVFLSFNVKGGTNNNQLTEIAKLPDWAIPHEKQYNQCMIRTSSGVSLATFDTQGWKHSTGVTEGTITIGLGWSSRTTWAAGQCIYKID